ncbi:hypothetical protein [Chryseobacterium mulctrae]|uniref:hypothetical protein n=1 Tax=Chryseobacterium mulctrae TaxID=2576777 RepID=UPI0011160794|nr:hypothetical protein [Chryseobacterium mulctrae]
MKHCIITFYKLGNHSLHFKESGDIFVSDENIVDEILKMKIFENGLQALFEYNGTEYMTSENFKIENEDSIVKFVRELAKNDEIESIDMYDCFTFSFPDEYVYNSLDWKPQE